jgi:ketosteroid isomerase-like protein
MAKMKSIGLLLVLGCAAVSLLPAQDDSEATTQSKIIALEKAWNQAYKLGDRKALDTLLDDHIVLINDDGSVQSKTQFLSTVKATSSQEQQVAPESMSVHVFGKTAIATGVFRAKGVEGGKHYARRERFVDTWLFNAGKWVCIATNATPVLH